MNLSLTGQGGGERDKEMWKGEGNRGNRKRAEWTDGRQWSDKRRESCCFSCRSIRKEQHEGGSEAPSLAFPPQAGGAEVVTMEMQLKCIHVCVRVQAGAHVNFLKCDSLLLSGLMRVICLSTALSLSHLLSLCVPVQQGGEVGTPLLSEFSVLAGCDVIRVTDWDPLFLAPSLSFQLVYV